MRHLAKLVLFVTILFSTYSLTHAQDPLDPNEYQELLVKEPLNDILDSLRKLSYQLQDQNDLLDSLESKVSGLKRFNKYIDKQDEISFPGNRELLAFLPFLFLFPGIAWSAYRLRKFDLKLALSETTVDKTTGKKTSSPSSSRLVIFYSGMVALSISLSLFIITIYIYLKTGVIPEFTNLINGLIVLGIGVVPYSISKVAGIFK